MTPRTAGPWTRSWPSWPRAGGSTPSATCGRHRRRSSRLPLLQELGAGLKRLGVLGAGLVETARVLLELRGARAVRVVALGRLRRRRPAALLADHAAEVGRSAERLRERRQRPRV